MQANYKKKLFLKYEQLIKTYMTYMFIIKLL